MLRKFFRYVYRRRSVRADNSDCRRLFSGETEQKIRAEERDENAELRSRTHKHTLRVGDKRTEIGHRADAEEDNRRENYPINAFIYVIE